MIKKVITYCVFVVSVFCQGLGQDIHFSQIDINPVLLNPAYSGFFEGKGRFGMVYRNQWASVSDPYQTYAFTAEWNVYRRRYYGDGINIGMSLARDESGTLDYGTTKADAIVSYFRRLNKSNNHFVSAGLSVGFGQQSFNSLNIILPEQSETFDVVKTKYPDLGFGLAWFYNPTDNFTIKVGLGAKHLNKPNISYMHLDDVYLHPNYNIYVRTEFGLTETLSLLPVVLCRFQDQYKEFLYGADFKWYCYQTYKTGINCSAGVYLRHADAVVFNLMLEFEPFVLGVAYDYNFSDLKPGSGGNGAFEIALLYRLNEHKRKKGNMSTCPTFL